MSITETIQQITKALSTLGVGQSAGALQAGALIVIAEQLERIALAMEKNDEFIKQVYSRTEPAAPQRRPERPVVIVRSCPTCGFRGGHPARRTASGSVEATCRSCNNPWKAQYRPSEWS